ncbi:MAG: site-specific DNA-methyltransferase [bacterium]|nr:site-specific DNA-methyltransferase [bacterium]
MAALEWLDRIVCGDCYTLIQALPDESVNLVITSPPYFQQRDYGGGIGSEDRVQDYIDNLLRILSECVRVLHPSGSIVFNLGDKYTESSLQLIPYRFAIAAAEKLPLQLVNAVTWVKRNPTPRQFKRRLVSSTEPFFHFVRNQGYYYNLDAFMQTERAPKGQRELSASKGKRYFELIEQSELTGEQKTLARQALTDMLQELAQGKIEDFRMKIRGLHSEPFGGQAGGRQIQLDKNGFTLIRIYGNPIKRDVIEMPVESVRSRNHPAMYPVNLVAEFLRLLTREGDVVLDPFMGSGSTAVACKQTGRHYIGFELNPEYCAFAEERLHQPATPRLFNDF